MQFAQMWPRAEIHAFEPSPTTFKALEINVAKVKPTVYLVNAGVGAQVARRFLIENSDSALSSFLLPTAEAWGHVTHKTPVDILTLDGYCGDAGVNQIDLLKIDAQGYDLEVLKGADQLLSNAAVRLIYLEVNFSPLYEDLPSFDAIYRFLLQHDYRFVGFYHPRFTQEGLMAWCDALFACAHYQMPVKVDTDSAGR